MAETSWKPGDRVVTPAGHGTVIDVRATPSGRWVFGVEDAIGQVLYFTAGALRLGED